MSSLHLLHHFSIWNYYKDIHPAPKYPSLFNFGPPQSPHMTLTISFTPLWPGPRASQHRPPRLHEHCPAQGIPLPAIPEQAHPPVLAEWTDPPVDQELQLPGDCPTSTQRDQMRGDGRRSAPKVGDQNGSDQKSVIRDGIGLDYLGASLDSPTWPLSFFCLPLAFSLPLPFFLRNWPSKWPKNAVGLRILFTKRVRKMC